MTVERPYRCYVRVWGEGNVPCTFAVLVARTRDDGTRENVHALPTERLRTTSVYEATLVACLYALKALDAKTEKLVVHTNNAAVESVINGHGEPSKYAALVAKLRAGIRDRGRLVVTPNAENHPRMVQAFQLAEAGGTRRRMTYRDRVEPTTATDRDQTEEAPHTAPPPMMNLLGEVIDSHKQYAWRLSYEMRPHLVEGDDGTKVEHLRAYTMDGVCIGTEGMAQWLSTKGIQPELALPNHKVCSVGFCKGTQRWWGWKGKQAKSFQIGSRMAWGDVGTPAVKEGESIAGETRAADHSLQVGFTARTLSDARQMAVAFAVAAGAR